MMTVTSTPYGRAGQVHRQLVALIHCTITDTGRTPAVVAAEAGMMPSMLRDVLSGLEVLDVPAMVSLAQVLGMRASDLLRLTERATGGEDLPQPTINAHGTVGAYGWLCT